MFKSSLNQNKMKITQQNFETFIKSQNKLVNTLNHRVTSIESNLAKMQINQKWMQRIGYYMAGVITAIATKLIVFS